MSRKKQNYLGEFVIKNGDITIPVILMALVGKYAMVRRADTRGASPFVVGVGELKEKQ